MNLAQILTIYAKSKFKGLSCRAYPKDRNHPVVKEFWRHVIDLDEGIKSLRYDNDNPSEFASAFSSLADNLQEMNAFMLQHSGEVLERWTGKDNLVLTLDSNIRANPADDYDWQIAHIATYNPLAAWQLSRLRKEMSE